MRFLVHLVVVLAPFLVLLSPAAHAFVGITPELSDRMAAMEPQDLVRVNVILKEQHDFAALTADLAALRGRQRRQALWERMAGRVEAAQAPVRRVLDHLIARGEAADPRTLVAANGVTVWLGRAAIEELASLPEVRSLDWDEERPVEEVIDRGTATSAAQAAAITWNITRVRAPEMWALGYTGQGVLIGVIDTGVNYNHLDLRDHMWDGGLSYPNHGWDFVNNDNNPIDEGQSGGHGTSVAGLCCGDGSAGTQTGVAPDATIMAIRCSGNTSSESMIWQGEDFAIQQGCDVVTMSLSWKYHFGPDYATWRTHENAIQAADIAHSQSAGNQNTDPCCPTPWNVSTPGNSPAPWLHPDQTLVGGLSGVTAVANVTQSDVIASTSSHGPSSWETIPAFGDYPYDPEMGLLKPDVAAPGDGTTSTTWNSNTGYSAFGGTSGAAPHVGGAYCILRQAHPTLNVANLSRVLQLSAVDLGPAGKDNRYGAGRIDLVAAHNLASLSIGAPRNLAAADTPGDLGGSIDLSWTLSPDDGGGNGLVEAYEIRRTTVPGVYLDNPIGSVPAGTGTYRDATTVDGTEYYYVVEAVGNDLRSVRSNEAGPVVSHPDTEGLSGVAAPARGRFLEVAGPNPFARATAVRFGLPASREIELGIYAVSGERVRVLLAGPVAAGEHEVAWDGRDAAGRRVPSGVYVARLASPRWTASRKLLCID